MSEQLYDVAAVNLKTNKVRLLDHGKTKENADAVVKMAVWRRGVDEEFFASVLMGKYMDDDTWGGKHP